MKCKCDFKYEPLLGYNDIVALLIEHGAALGDLWTTTEANKVGSSTTETEEDNSTTEVVTTSERYNNDYYDLYDDGDSTDYDNLWISNFQLLIDLHDKISMTQSKYDRL